MTAKSRFYPTKVKVLLTRRHLFHKVGVAERFSAPLASDVLAAVLLEFGVAAQNHRSIFFVEFKHIANSVCLFASDKRTARTAEGVEDDAVGMAAVLYRISELFKRLARGVVAVLSWLGKVPDGGFAAPRIPLMRTRFEPAVKNRLVLPLVRRTSHNKAVLDPNASAAKMEARLPKRSAEVFPLCVGMEDIRGTAAFQVVRKAAKRRKQEII